MHRLNINSIITWTLPHNIGSDAGGVGLPPPPPPPPPFPYGGGFSSLFGSVCSGFPTLSVFEESKTGLEKEIDYCLGLILRSY